MTCEYFMRKTGGYYYGFKCSLYHKGNFDLYSDGERIEFDRLYSSGKYEKESRDKYVENVCKSNCGSCSLLIGHNSRNND